MKTWLLGAIASGALLISMSERASAALVETVIPTNAYIVSGGLDWAWAYPLPASASGFDLSFQAQFGWRLPTLAELAFAPNAVDFLFAEGNVPFNGSDPVSGATFAATNAAYTGAGACATPYFSLSFLHCDWQDGNGQTFPPWAGLPGAFDFADQLVVRFDVDATPIPAALPLFASALGLGGLIGWRRKRRANVSIAPA